MFAQLPDFIARKLYRSFDGERLIEDVSEIRKKHPTKKYVFLIFDAGILELLAIRYFFLKKWGDDFVVRRALGYEGILVNPFSETLKWFFSTLGLSKNKFSLARIVRRELAEGHPLVVNLPIGFRAGKISSQERLLEYLIQSEKEQLLLIPLVFIWRRVGRKMEFKDEDLSSKLIRTIKSPFLLPWHLLLGDPQKPLGLRKLIMMLRGYSRSVLRVATTLEVTAESTLQLLRREAIRAIQKEKKVALGPIYKPSRGIWEQILRNPEFLAFVKKYSIEEDAPEKKVLRQSEQILKEIAADYSYSTIELAGWVLEKVFHIIYQGFTFDKEQLRKVRAASKDGVLVFIPNHRSYLDFLVLSYFLFREQMIPPHVAAGINLNFWPVGTFFKEGGAFFIRRSFRGDKLYSEILRRYVLTIMNNKINIEFFIEGMRSRVGKMTPPKYGMMKMIIDAHLQGKFSEKLYLVPVSITYDRVTEDKMHKRELEGGAKVQENAFNAIKGSFGVLLRRFGRVHLRLGEPYLLDDAIAKFTPKDDLEDFSRWIVPRVSFEVCHRINNSTPLTAAALVCTVLIARPGAAISRADLEKVLLFIEKDLNHFSIPKEPELEMHYLSCCLKVLSRLVKEGTVQEYKLQDGGVGFKISESERITALYYKNTAIHAFLLPAIWGMAQKDETKALALRSLLRFEFFFQRREDFLSALKQIPESVNCYFYSCLVEDVLENIYWNMDYLAKRSDLKLEEKEWAQRLLKYGHEKLLESEIKRREAVNTHSIKAFVEMAKNEGWLVSTGSRALSVELNQDFENKKASAKSFLSPSREWEQIKDAWK